MGHYIDRCITGAVAMGKSTLVNGIIGHVVAPVRDESALEDETQGDPRLQLYQKKIGNIEVNVWDSPGLQATCLEDIKQNCRESVDLFLYCIDM